MGLLSWMIGWSWVCGSNSRQRLRLHKSSMNLGIRAGVYGLVATTISFSSQTLVLADIQRFRLKPEKSVVTTKIKDPFGNIVGGSLRVREGEASADPNRLSESGTVNVLLDATSYDSDLGLRDKTVREDYLEVQQYPTIQFSARKVVEVERSVSVATSWNVLLRGTLLFHGVKKEITVPVGLRYEGKKVVAQGRLRILLEDFKVAVPNLLFLKAGNQVDVEFSIVGER